MFEPFPDNYTWCLGVNLALNSGGQINDVDQVIRELRGRSKPADEEAWYEAWKKAAGRLEWQAQEDEAAGRIIGAARKYRRAFVYYTVAERHMTNKDFRKLETYKHSLTLFEKAMRLGGEDVQFIDVPFEGSVLPSLYLPPHNAEGPAPAIVFFNGFDGTKELQFLWGSWELQNRGIGVLICDHPGVGGALRLYGMPTRYDTEVPAGACVDWLEQRPEIDSNRIGMMAPSLGGYYAPRAATFEKRFKCCIAWGAHWDYGDLWAKRLKGGSEYPVPPFQLTWVLGTETAEEAVEKLRKFTLDGVIDKLECPLLILHGENDRQVPVELARRAYETAGSKDKELKVFTIEEGGAEHCQLDDHWRAMDYIVSWAVEKLGARTPAAV
jgi:dienelactone hydrolase